MGRFGGTFAAHSGQATTRRDTDTQGNDMHRQTTTRAGSDYESAALPLSYWPYTPTAATTYTTAAPNSPLVMVEKRVDICTESAA